ncbi:MAG TPA: hypothetical protein VFH78_08395, partial [Candidatus Thermoplasmatota archaeon]|nr:hypothetical protein [Candidatus Thermoplasmatota archaeon]
GRRPGEPVEAELRGGLVVEERVVERGEPAPWEGRFVRAFGVGELREGAAVVGWFDAWVPDRQVVQDAAAQFRLDGLSGPAAEIIEPHAGPALAVGWRNAPGVNYALTLHRVEP